MNKRFVLTLAAFLSATLALAGSPQTEPAGGETKTAVVKAVPITGTITSIKGVRVEIEVSDEKPAWVKRGAALKLPDIKGGLGKIVDVSATGITFNTKKASELKVGDTVTLAKGTIVPAGC
jgi:hypothetical protein